MVRLVSGELTGSSETAVFQTDHAVLSAFQKVIFNSPNFMSITIDAQGVIQLFNLGAQQMLGYTDVEVIKKTSFIELCDEDFMKARAEALSEEFNLINISHLDALLFRASRGLEENYPFTFIGKNGRRLLAMVSIVALCEAKEDTLQEDRLITGYLLMGTTQGVQKETEDAFIKTDALQSAIFNSANFSSDNEGTPIS